MRNLNIVSCAPADQILAKMTDLTEKNRSVLVPKMEQ